MVARANSQRAIPNIVINEIMFHPILYNDDDEFVEVHNRSGGDVDIGGWRLVDGVTFEFPAQTVIPAGGFLAVAKNVAQLRANNPTLTAANSVGDFGGSLSNN